jgi:hypothetical protein
MSAYILSEVHALGNSFNPIRGSGRYPVHVSLEPDRIVVIRGGAREQGRYERRQIEKFSKSSKRRMQRYIRCSDSTYRALGCLTYPADYKVDGLQASQHLENLWRRWSRLKAKTGDGQQTIPSWFWFMEFTSKGQVHFHFASTHFIPKAWLSKAWAEITNTGNKLHQAAGTRIESLRAGKRGLSVYAAKYAAKQEQKAVPEGFGKVGRFWGIMGNRDMLAYTVTNTLDDCEYRRLSMAIVRACDAILDAEYPEKIGFTFKYWDIATDRNYIPGVTFEIKSTRMRNKLERLIREIKFYAKGNSLPTKPDKKTILYRLCGGSDSLELLRRYPNAKSRHNEVRSKAAGIPDDCFANRRPRLAGSCGEYRRASQASHIACNGIRRVSGKLGGSVREWAGLDTFDISEFHNR